MALKLFLKNFEPPFLKKYQHLHNASFAQSLRFVGLYHRLKYLHNLQSHFVYSSLISEKQFSFLKCTYSKKILLRRQSKSLKFKRAQ
jgi:hypothetical protein